MKHPKEHQSDRPEDNEKKKKKEGKSCIKWRQTHGCDPNGEREVQGDQECMTLVKRGWSGYCECENGRRGYEVGCDHGLFTCDKACKDPLFLQTQKGCVRWHQTAGCDPRGKNEAGEEKGCKQVIQNGLSGYCECAGGRRANRSEDVG